MTTNNLTELWKKGELDEGWYYIETDVPFEQRHKDISYYSLGSFDIDIDSNYITEVLAEVPDCVEWKNYVTMYNYEHEENKQLKELIKECIDGLEKIKHIGETKKLGAVYQVAERTLAKIDEALK